MRWDDLAARAAAYDRLERRLATPMLLLALVLVPVLFWPVVDPDLAPTTERWLLVVDVAIWVAFAVEYGVKLALAPSRRRFVATHVPDLLLLLVPFLRPLRVLGGLRLLRLVGLSRVLVALVVAGRRAERRWSIHPVGWTASAAAGLVLVAAFLIVELERRDPDANIDSLPDALWWGITTVTTVGYGDRFPVTTAGRVLAAMLMLVGIALLGVVTASLASWFVARVSRRAAAATSDAESAVAAELAALRAAVEALARPCPTCGTPPAPVPRL